MSIIIIVIIRSRKKSKPGQCSFILMVWLCCWSEKSELLFIFLEAYIFSKLLKLLTFNCYHNYSLNTTGLKILGFVICAVALALVEQAIVKKKKQFDTGQFPHENVTPSTSGNNQMLLHFYKHKMSSPILSKTEIIKV